MKKTILLLLNILWFTSCKSEAKNSDLPLKISGTITNAVNGKIYLEKLNDRNIGVKIDSVSLTGQTFKFDTKIPEPGIYQINIANEQIIGLILDGGEELNIVADGSSTPDKAATANVQGSKNMTVFNEVMAEMQKFSVTRNDLESKFQKLKTEAERTKLRAQYQSAEANMKSVILPKIKDLGTSMSGIIAANNFLNPETDFEYLNQLKNNLIAEGKNHFFAKMFIQTINQKNAGSVGTPAPDFELSMLDGKKIKLSELKGKTVIIDFWATWCGPCIMAFPGMKKAVEKYKDRDDVVFLFVNTFERVAPDQWKDHVNKFVTNRGLTFMNPVLDIGNETAMVYGVEGIPAKFCIDKNGNIKHKGSGYLGSTDAVFNEMVEWIEK